MNSRFETLDIYFDIQSRFWEHIKDNRENWMESNSDTYMKNIMALKQKSLQYLQNVLESRKLL